MQKYCLNQTLRKNIVGYAFLAPFLILFFTFIILPVLSAFVLSLTNYNMLQTPDFVGLNNYKLLLLEDNEFITALKNTFVFACISGPIGFLASFFFAAVINSTKFKSGFALAFYAPSLCSGVAMSCIWLYFFSSDRYGFINNILINLDIIEAPILWTADPNYIMYVIVIISIWMSMGTGFLVFLAGLQNLGVEVLEAARIDGIKNRVQEMIYIILPMMKPQLLFGAINSIVSSFAVYDIAVAVAGLPSPEYAGHTIVAHMCDYAFNRMQMGYASAVAVILFVITFVLGRICTKIFSSDGE